MTETYQARTARYRREEEDRVRERLRGAIKRDTHLAVWNFELDAELRGSVRTLQAMGYKAEVEYDKETNKMRLIAVRYKNA